MQVKTKLRHRLLIAAKGLCLICGIMMLSSTTQAVRFLEMPSPTNTVVVDYLVDEDNPPQLTLFQDGEPIDIIEFTADKRYIRFTFPEGYSDPDIRVFEMFEIYQKLGIEQIYRFQPSYAVNRFNSQWEGFGSSQLSFREFRAIPTDDNSLLIINYNYDGTAEGRDHPFLIRYTFDGVTYLQDPSIRNRNTVSK